MKHQLLTVDNVYNALKRDFLNNEIEYGEKLVVRTLEERYQTSATPVKQALNRLVSEGLVAAIPRRGFFRKEISYKSIKDILEVRMMIEQFYAKRIIENLDLYPEIVDRMSLLTNEIHDIILQMESIEDYLKMYQLDKKFHLEYLSCAGNEQAMLIYDRLGTHSYEGMTYGRMSKERLISGSVEEHYRIIDAIKNKDSVQLQNNIMEHYENIEYTFELTLQHDLLTEF